MSILDRFKRAFNEPDEEIGALSDEDWDHAMGVSPERLSAWRWYLFAGGILGLIFAAVRSISPW